MAVYRQIHITYWQDVFILDLTPEEKYFYLYLMTNSKTTQCGIYELPIKIAVMETGYNTETVEKLFAKFEKYKKIIRSKKTTEICIVNWLKYNVSKSPKVLKCIHNELDNVKDKALLNSIDTVCIEYTYSMDTEPQKEKEQEKEKQPEKEKGLMLEIEDLFLKADKINYNYKYERKSIYTLIEKIKDLFNKDPVLEEIGIISFVKNIIVIYAENKKAGKKIFQNPIVPHILGSNKTFPQILEVMQQEKIHREKDESLNTILQGVSFK